MIKRLRGEHRAEKNEELKDKIRADLVKAQQDGVKIVADIRVLKPDVEWGSPKAESEESALIDATEIMADGHPKVIDI